MWPRLIIEPTALESLEAFPRVFEAIEALPSVGTHIVGSITVEPVTASIVVRIASRPLVFIDVERLEIDLCRIDGRKITHVFRLLAVKPQRSRPSIKRARTHVKRKRRQAHRRRARTLLA
ncbi:MAG TPA: hypothetical protein VFO25_10515 [Candidatus Eremiobacteraceae bacterium]|nr:hypothetical protein [Candidatus Eremiobacteraceae bacterium]